MKRLFSFLALTIVLIFSSVGDIHPSKAQDPASAHDELIASIPTLLNLENQADTTFVGEVTGSYAYIAFVVQDNLVVAYVCDSVQVGVWLRGEVVDGQIDLASESGIRIVSSLSDGSIDGTVVLPIDDDGTTPIEHAFSAVPTIAGETGLARLVDDYYVSGWIVTENGIRGFRARREQRITEEACNIFRAQWDNYYTLMQNNDENVYLYMNAAYDMVTVMEQAGCTNLP